MLSEADNNQFAQEEIVRAAYLLADADVSPRCYLPETFRYFGRFNIQGVPLIQFLPVALIVLVTIGANSSG